MKEKAKQVIRISLRGAQPQSDAAWRFLFAPDYTSRLQDVTMIHTNVLIGWKNESGNRNQ